MAVLPPLVVVFALSYLLLSSFNAQQLQQVNLSNQQTADLIAGIIAKSSYQSDLTELDRMLVHSLGKNFVSALAVYDSNGKLITQAGQFQGNNSYRVLEFLSASSSKLVRVDIPVPEGIKTENHYSLISEFDHSPLGTSRFQTIAYALFTVFIALIVLGFFATMVARKTLDAINDFKNVLQAYNNGRYSEKLPDIYKGETQNLANLINELGDRIQRSQALQQAQMEQTTTDLQETLETIEVQNIQLNIARKDALKGSQSKSEFLANTSHEIRTPLGGIIGFSNLLEKTELDAQQRDYVGIIHQSAQNLHSILNDILDFSRIEAGMLTLDYTDFELRPTLEHCISILSPLLADKEIQVTLEIKPEVAEFIYSDPLRLQQILMNLMANAIKFTEYGLVNLIVEPGSSEEFLKFTVHDSGIGLDEEQQARLFTAFSQADSGTSRKYGGSGLGLSISKHLVELLGGEIDFETSKGKGSSFFFNIQALAATAKQRKKPLEGVLVGVIEPLDTVSNAICQQLEHQGANCLQLTSIEVSDSWHADIYVLTIQHSLLKELAEHSNPSSLLQQKLATIPANNPVLLLQPFSTILPERLASSRDQTLITRFPISSEKLSRRLCSLLGKTGAEPMNHSAGKIGNLHQSQLNFLAVDDNSANLKLIKILLEDLGINVSTANSGKQAIQLCKEKTFDLIFMDIQMPELDGYQTTDHIRAKCPNNSETVIVALTAHAMADEKRKILDSGFNVHLTKPISEIEICETIKDSLDLEDYESLLGIQDEARQHNQQQAVSPEPQEVERPVNIELALSLSNYKVSIAQFMLQELLNELGNFMHKIRTLSQQQNWGELLEVTHRLHGASCYTGTVAVKNCSMNLEKALKSGDVEQYQDLVDELIAACEALALWSEQHDLKLLFSD